MRANPGGQIDLNEIVGRELLIEQIWQTLEQQSIRLVAERRIGKTTIIRQLKDKPKANWVAIFQDLEKCHTALDFAYAIYHDAHSLLSARKKSVRKASELLKKCGGLEISGLFKIPVNNTQLQWKDLLHNTIEDLLDSQDGAQYLLFLWDELPFMLDNIKQREGATVAMEVLDSLRALRQQYASSGLRMVLTGSIGLHHVIGQLKQQNYANAPVNDTYAMPVPPLAATDAQVLAEKLLQGEGIPCNELAETAIEIAQQADGFPFYVHHIVKALKLSGEAGSPQTVQKIVRAQLTDDNDPWELNHYQSRIATYYGAANVQTVLMLLDSLALATQAMPLSDILKELKSSGVDIERQALIDLLKLIAQDHYLTRNDEGHYQFQFPLLQRWWKLSRGL